MRFVFIVPFRNCRSFIGEAAESLLRQECRDWVAYFRDDCSYDGGADNIPSDPRIVVQRTPVRIGGLMNMHEAIVGNGLGPDDIVCLMDGDDYLTTPDALGILGCMYERTSCLISYGQYESQGVQSGHCRAYGREEFSRLRSAGFLASHLKTFRHRLYMEAMRQDPECDRYKDGSGKFFDMATDVAIMTPLLEVAGFDRVAFNPEVLYHYRSHPMNEHHFDSAGQSRQAAASLAKVPLRHEPL